MGFALEVAVPLGSEQADAGSARNAAYLPLAIESARPRVRPLRRFPFCNGKTRDRCRQRELFQHFKYSGPADLQRNQLSRPFHLVFQSTFGQRQRRGDACGEQNKIGLGVKIFQKARFHFHTRSDVSGKRFEEWLESFWSRAHRRGRQPRRLPYKNQTDWFQGPCR